MDSYSNSKKSKKQSYIISDVSNCTVMLVVTQVYRTAKELGMQAVNVIYFTLFNSQFK